MQTEAQSKDELIAALWKNGRHKLAQSLQNPLQVRLKHAIGVKFPGVLPHPESTLGLQPIGWALSHTGQFEGPITQTSILALRDEVYPKVLEFVSGFIEKALASNPQRTFEVALTPKFARFGCVLIVEIAIFHQEGLRTTDA